MVRQWIGRQSGAESLHVSERQSETEQSKRAEVISHSSAQDNTTMMGWLGGKAVGERKCAFATTHSAMETNKVLHFVPSGKWMKALRAVPQLCTTQTSLGEPWGSLPSETWEPPVKKRADPPPLPLRRTTDVWVCMCTSVHTWCFLCLLFLCT